MCYTGSPILLAEVLTWPKRSIIKQSYDARERLLDPTLPQHLGHGNLNGDGFGIGWYGEVMHCKHQVKVPARASAAGSQAGRTHGPMSAAPALLPALRCTHRRPDVRLS